MSNEALQQLIVRDAAKAKRREQQRLIQLETLEEVLHNYEGAGAPTTSNDESEGYSIGSLWFDGNNIYICTDATDGAAVWLLVGALPGEGGHARLHDLDSVLDHEGTLSWDKVDKTGSDLADIETANHSDLDNVGEDDHHARLHDWDDALDHTIEGAKNNLLGLIELDTPGQFAPSTNSKVSPGKVVKSTADGDHDWRYLAADMFDRPRHYGIFYHGASLGVQARISRDFTVPVSGGETIWVNHYPGAPRSQLFKDNARAVIKIPNPSATIEVTGGSGYETPEIVGVVGDAAPDATGENTITHGLTILEDDCIYLIGQIRAEHGSTPITWTVPSGFELADQVDGDSHTITCWVKVSAGSEPASYTVDGDSTDTSKPLSLVCIVVRNLDLSVNGFSEIDVVFNSSASTNATAPAVTALTDKDLLFYVGAISSFSPDFGDISGMTNHLEIERDGSGEFMSLNVQSEQLDASGDTGTRTSVITSSRETLCMSICLRAKSAVTVTETTGLDGIDIWGTLTAWSDETDQEESYTFTPDDYDYAGTLILPGTPLLSFGVSGDAYGELRAGDPPSIGIGTWTTDVTDIEEHVPLVRAGKLSNVDAAEGDVGFYARGSDDGLGFEASDGRTIVILGDGEVIRWLFSDGSTVELKGNYNGGSQNLQVIIDGVVDTTFS